MIRKMRDNIYPKGENSMEENKENITVVNEKIYQINESKIKYAVSEYTKTKPLNSLISISGSGIISFLIAFASYVESNSYWKIVFLLLLIVSLTVFVICSITLFIQRRIGKNSQKWLFEEITNTHPIKYKSRVNKRKRAFITVNIFLIVGIPTLVILLVLGCNGWNIWDKNWAPIFMVGWTAFTLMYLTFGTFVNSFFSNLLFDYDFFEDD